jgi:hypothetical protein
MDPRLLRLPPAQRAGGKRLGDLDRWRRKLAFKDQALGLNPYCPTDPTDPHAYDAAAFEPSAAMGSAAEERMVCRLFAGGSRIRTIGTA